MSAPTSYVLDPETFWRITAFCERTRAAEALVQAAMAEAKALARLADAARAKQVACLADVAATCGFDPDRAASFELHDDTRTIVLP